MKNKMIGASLVALSMATATSAEAAGVKFKPMLDARLRYENVKQEGPAPVSPDREAQATTIRLRPGFELSSGPFAFLVEAEMTMPFQESYNSSVNFKTQYPVIADPDNFELNRIQLQYRGIKKTVVTIGRQRINLDDQRFVGSVGWRQNEQTFDAVRVEYSGIKNLKADVTYAWANRTIFGYDGLRDTQFQQSIDGDNVFATLGYTTKLGTLTGFAYLIDQGDGGITVHQRSSQTYGGRFAGAYPITKKIKLSYAASLAGQKNYKTNPISYQASYKAGELNLDAYGFKLTGGYEELGADGYAFGIAGNRFAFQTPLATLHKFNGWADKFLATPNNGLRDYYAGIGYTFPKLGIGKLGPLSAQLVYHKFTSDLGAAATTRTATLGKRSYYGNEWNAQISLKLNKRITLLGKYADYNAKRQATDTRKYMLQMDFSY